MRRSACLAAAAAMLVAAGFLTGCGSRSADVAARPGTGATDLPASPSHSGTSPPVSPGAVPAAASGPAGLLQRIDTERHADHDRILFSFHGRTAPNVRALRYVDAVTEDPSDRPVPLTGQAFVLLVFDGARLDTAAVESDPAKALRYAGPRRLTPRYPVLRELAVAGDFEAMLSFGVGLARPAGLGVRTQTDPARVVLDIWYEAPDRLLFPVQSRAQARSLQDSVDRGHQPWLCNPADVVASYASGVLGWSRPNVRRLATNVYQVDHVGAFAVVTVVRAFPGIANSIWVVADVAR
jgi:hypothetical protein